MSKIQYTILIKNDIIIRIIPLLIIALIKNTINFSLFFSYNEISTNFNKYNRIFIGFDNFSFIFLISSLLKFDKYALKVYFFLSIRKFSIFLINIKTFKVKNFNSLIIYFFLQIIEFISIFIINKKIYHYCIWYNSKIMNRKNEGINSKF